METGDSDTPLDTGRWERRGDEWRVDHGPYGGTSEVSWSPQRGLRAVQGYDAAVGDFTADDAEALARIIRAHE